MAETPWSNLSPFLKDIYLHPENSMNNLQIYLMQIRKYYEWTWILPCIF